MFKFHARFIFGFFAATALILSAYALVPPVKRNDDLVMIPDICAKLNVDLTVLLTSIAQCAKSGADSTSLWVELVAQLQVCAEAIVEIKPNTWDKTTFITLVVNLFINIFAVIKLFDISALLIILLSAEIKLDAVLSLILKNCDIIFANVVVIISAQLTAIVTLLVELKLLLTIKILGLISISL
ncbi:hypothetical protein SISSUDRAFT_1033319 [Sistotremastrum suecicum HHB10207 ss-3]|uniref:Transmembrane protein n=1 Tax=Sistotremastrum suecicum HHB10207 ss-3 TaxID=1314776 RepID=A0A166DI70_9AGAM|nr:hypothetical protein SISSUDRAFT_1033319 [Sistotremastrum suecicum HHB10207 ss-3]